MDPLCAPVYLDLTEMDGTAQVKALREDVNILRIVYSGRSASKLCFKTPTT